MSYDFPLFLDADDVIELHATQLERYGGAPGLRDRGLLESAVAQAQASFDGVFAHEGPFAMASAYLFHIVSNHAFVDGNKRAGLLAALVFLDINGISIEHSSEALYTLTMGVAEGRVTKTSVALEVARIVARLEGGVAVS